MAIRVYWLFICGLSNISAGFGRLSAGFSNISANFGRLSVNLQYICSFQSLICNLVQYICKISHLSASLPIISAALNTRLSFFIIAAVTLQKEKTEDSLSPANLFLFICIIFFEPFKHHFIGVVTKIQAAFYP